MRKEPDLDDNRAVVEFYDASHPLLRIHSPRDHEIHYGLWEEGTKSSSEASRNTTRFVAKCLALNEKDKVLDAGCGLGGTTIYLTENFGMCSLPAFYIVS